MNPGGLDPRVASEVNRTTGEPLDHDAFQEELFLVAVDHRDGPGLAKGRVHRELSRVRYSLRLDALLVEPVSKCSLAACFRLFRPCK